MISLFVALCIVTSVKSSNNKELQVQKVKCGESVHIKCDVFSVNDLFWYKQDLGKGLQMALRRAQNTIRYNEGFNDGRFIINDKNQFILTIIEVKEEDTGLYFCAKVLKSSLHFGSGTLLIVEAEEMKRLPPTVTMTEDGDSLTLQCSVRDFTSNCGEQSVYWFRHDSGESPPGIVYAHGDGSDECKKNSEAGSPPQSCVYTLPKRKLQTSDKGTFYCAVAACGQILIGNGTEVKEDQRQENKQWIVFVLIATNIISIIVIMALIWVLLQTQRKGASSKQQNNTHQADDEDVLNYAAVSFAKKPSSSRTSRDTRHEDVYAHVKIK